MAGVLLPEEHGGTDLGVAAAAAIAERLGYACHSEAFVAVAVTAARCVTLCPQSALRNELLKAIGSGSQSVAVAWQPARGDLTIDALEVVAEPDADGITLRGTARFVVPAHAGAFIVAARIQGEPSLCVVPSGTTGLTVVSEKRADGSCSGWLKLRDVRISQTALLAHGEAAHAALDGAIESGVLFTSAELLGLIERSLEITQEYLGVRHQFGQPIGSFQVLQHRLVDMWIQKELTRAALRSALAIFSDRASSPEARRAASSSAKAMASHAATFIAGQAVQLHGAIGFSDEYDLGVYVNRSLTLAAHYGNAATHRGRFGALVAVEER